MDVDEPIRLRVKEEHFFEQFSKVLGPSASTDDKADAANRQAPYSIIVRVCCLLRARTDHTIRRAPSTRTGSASRHGGPINLENQSISIKSDVNHDFSLIRREHDFHRGKLSCSLPDTFPFVFASINPSVVSARKRRAGKKGEGRAKKPAWAAAILFLFIFRAAFAWVAFFPRFCAFPFALSNRSLFQKEKKDAVAVAQPCAAHGGCSCSFHDARFSQRQQCVFARFVSFRFLIILSPLLLDKAREIVESMPQTSVATKAGALAAGTVRRPYDPSFHPFLTLFSA